MNRKTVFAAIAVLLIIAITATLIIVNNTPKESKPFYVGVTYGGDNTADAKLLIDKVKDYTNLFILASGNLQRNTTAIEEIGDYAIAQGLNFAAYFGIIDGSRTGAEWVDTAQQRWGGHFLGVYFYDEPGGRILDTSEIHFLGNAVNGTSIDKLPGGVSVASRGNQIVYYVNGTTRVVQSVDDKSKNGSLEISGPDVTPTTIPNVPWPENIDTIYDNGTFAHFIKPEPLTTTITYSADGDVTVFESQTNTLYTAANGSLRISHVEPLSAVQSRNPLRTYDDAAQVFQNRTAGYLESLSDQPVSVFTSDYALYWWDYKGGYDMVLAELGWNNTEAQEIGLVRGAANLQGKEWGTIITWKYTQPPYLGSGEEMYNQLRLSYECGANYAVVFNFAEDANGAYGTLQDEHFQALERFWNDVVQNSSVVHGGIKAETALVLPRNYGWGMRNSQDNIWGLWAANGTSQQVWSQVQNRLAEFGSKLDIVYEDPAYPVAGKYAEVYYWNQTT